MTFAMSAEDIAAINAVMVAHGAQTVVIGIEANGAKRFSVRIDRRNGADFRHYVMGNEGFVFERVAQS